MDEGSGYLEKDPLFVGLTRPTMFLGVSFMYAGLNGMAGMIYFINTKSFTSIFLMILGHLIGYIICFKEPLFLELFMVKMQKCNFCKNKFYHGANSYDSY